MPWGQFLTILLQMFLTVAVLYVISGMTVAVINGVRDNQLKREAERKQAKDVVDDE